MTTHNRWRPRLDRRTVLKGLLGGSVVAIGLPALELFFDGPGQARAAGTDSGFPRRFGLFFWGNGMLPARWNPTGEGKDWQLSDQLAPLAKLKPYLTVVSGTRLAVSNSVPHFAGAAGVLSGRPVLVQGNDETFGGPSIDQVIAAKLGETTRFRSLEFGAAPGPGLSYNGANSRNPPETSPHKLFERLFGTGFTLPGQTPVIDPTLGLRRSVLDAVGEDVQRLHAQVGQADKLRLDAHFAAIRSLEKRLAKLQEDPPDLAACKLPLEPAAAYPDFEGRPLLAEKNKAFAALSAMALACDQTRVFSNWFSYPVNNVLFQGAPAGHHQLTHDEPGAQPLVHAIVLQCMQALADQIDALAAIQEGDGTLLDHCVLLGTSEVSLGKTHSLEDMPLVLAGGCNGKLKTGIHYRSPSGENTSKVLLSLCRAVGVELASFGGEEGETTEGLGAIEA